MQVVFRADLTMYVVVMMVNRVPVTGYTNIEQIPSRDQQALYILTSIHL